ncbi:hypothetical protein ILUMI_08166 [Ignelater luminosus]|uniref:Uncharacterized protein n=1 Tax=Ignelater luminosus TaxID=2038154 RepID=A0A8K0D4Y0_IGNLU|nr:hypothetical protein ILUMI_08166 [Ignelater luminosus]
MKPYSPEEVLDLIISLKFSKQEYQTLRSEARERNVNLYPAYNKVRGIKQTCYPNEENIQVQEISAQFKLQALLDDTTRRIAAIQEKKNITNKLENILPNSIDCIYKYGCDGSFSQSQYKRIFTHPGEHDDSSVFISSIVPVQCTQNLHQMIKNNTVAKSKTRLHKILQTH